MFEYDFTQTINTQQLIDEINTAGLPAATSISTTSNNVQIFYNTVLTTDQQNTLSNVVLNHVANPNYIPIATQVQITKLIGYLNNSNTTISNTARAVIITNIAPGLSQSLLTTINNQICTIVGS